MKSAARPAHRRPQAALPAQLPDDPLLAAAVLLPALDAEASKGHVASGQAALLLRKLVTAGPALPTPPPLEELAGAVERLLLLVARQDRQIARLQAMLDALL